MVMIMRKEKLLEMKVNVSQDMPWFLKNVICEDELRAFSVNQLEILKNIFERAEIYRENHSPFFVLSATEILQKSTGSIACFDGFGNVCNESEDDIMSGASANIYKGYLTAEGLLVD